MPYYVSDRKQAEKIIRNQVCAECGRRLYIYFEPDTKREYVACSDQHEHIAREYQSPREDYQSNIRRETELEKEHGVETAKALATIPKQGQLTQPQAEHILSLVYPGCPKDEIVRCAILCRDFGLHPLMKEVYLIPFKDKNGKANYTTVLGINATRKLMAQRGTYSYIDDTPRLMNEDEQKRIFGEVDDKNIVAITKLRTKDGLDAPGYGKWPMDKEPYGTDKGNTKANMAFIRSERNAFSRLSPDALPVDVEVIDEAYAEAPDTSKVDIETGEIIEAEVTELPEAEGDTGGEVMPSKDETLITPEQVSDLTALLKHKEMSLGELGKWMVEKGWNIRKLNDLAQWQYNAIQDAFKRGE